MLRRSSAHWVAVRFLGKKESRPPRWAAIWRGSQGVTQTCRSACTCAYRSCALLMQAQSRFTLACASCSKRNGLLQQSESALARHQVTDKAQDQERHNGDDYATLGHAPRPFLAPSRACRRGDNAPRHRLTDDARAAGFFRKHPVHESYHSQEPTVSASQDSCHG